MTTIDLKKFQHKITPAPYSYNGVPIFCTGGIHEGVFEAFSDLKLANESPILVLGSGAGAFERRLLDNKYTNITSVEFIPENFIVKGTRLLSLDLNNDFSDIGKFDAIIAIEIIEHLENQFHFMRCIKKLLNKNGTLFLTTPNVENTFARMKFLILGKLHWFGPAELGSTGHISPIFDHILKLNLKQAGLTVERHFGNATIWSKLFQHQSLLVRIGYFCAFVATRPLQYENDFEINIFVISSLNGTSTLT